MEKKKHAIPYFLFIWFWKNTSTKTTAVIGITSCLEEKLQSLSPPIREAQSYPLSLYLPKCDCFVASHLVVCQLNSRLYKLNIGLRKKGMGSRKFSKGRVTQPVLTPCVSPNCLLLLLLIEPNLKPGKRLLSGGEGSYRTEYRLVQST